MPIDYKKYPPNWKSEIVPKVLKRANNCCEFCGLENKALIYSFNLKGNKGRIWANDEFVKRHKDLISNIKVVKVVLTVAHLDHDAENHNVSLDRLRALCQYCHLKYDKEMKSKGKV